jgi:preprotein translocase subunit SecA
LRYQNTKAANDFKSFEFDLIRYFSITPPCKRKRIAKDYRNGADGKVYKEALKYYNENVSVAQEAFPIVKIYTKKNNQFERIVVPFTDGVKSLSVVTDLKRAYETEENN